VWFGSAKGQKKLPGKSVLYLVQIDSVTPSFAKISPAGQDKNQTLCGSLTALRSDYLPDGPRSHQGKAANSPIFQPFNRVVDPGFLENEEA